MDVNRPSEDRDLEASRSETASRSGSAEPAKTVSGPPIDPGDYTVEELKDELWTVIDSDDLEAILNQEENNSDRRTAKEAIRRRVRTLDESEE